MTYKLTLSLILLLIATSLLSLMVGKLWISPMDFLGVVDQDIVRTIILDIRLPRTLAVLFVGAALAISGAVLQGYLRNPLADSGVLGLSSCAALAVLIVSGLGGLGMAGGGVATISALVGAGIGLLLLLFVAGRFGMTITVVILTGLMIASLTSALIALVIALSANPFALADMMMWLMGSAEQVTSFDLLFALPPGIIGAFLAIRNRKILDAFSFGEDVAKSMGYRLNRSLAILFAAISLMIGAAVALCGVIGFVGLITPHLARPLVGHRPGDLVMISGPTGAVILLLADILLRLLPGGSEMRLGAVTALLGCPLFLVILRSLRQTGQS